jgi:hypothetical protein
VARRVFWILAVASIVTLTWMGRGLTFFSDEWAFITSRSLADPTTWWAPHNEHWSTVPVLAYRALVETVGLRSYVPYLLVIAVLHALVAWLVFRAVERRADPAVALGAASIVLFFGAGFENLYWGFQVGFVGSMVAGLVALDALDGVPSSRRAAVVAGALLVAEMASGMGILFASAAALLMVASTAWQRWLWVLAIPASAYAAWFVLIGRSGVGVFRDPLAASSIAAVPGFVADGFEAALGAATGLDPLGPGLLVLAVGLAGFGAARGWRPTPRVAALLLAIAAQYALIAVTRAGVTATQVAYPRYTYVSGILMVEILALAAGPAIGRFRTAAALSPTGWRRIAGLAAAPVVLTLALTWNLQLLVAGRAVFLERAALTRALIAESLQPDPPPGADLTRDLILVPSPIVIRQLVAEHGSPLGDATVPWAVEPIPESLLAEARRRLVEGPPIPVPGDGT